jgi:hypothetical protein
MDLMALHFYLMEVERDVENQRSQGFVLKKFHYKA